MNSWPRLSVKSIVRVPNVTTGSTPRSTLTGELSGRGIGSCFGAPRWSQNANEHQRCEGSHNCFLLMISPFQASATGSGTGPGAVESGGAGAEGAAGCTRADSGSSRAGLRWRIESQQTWCSDRSESIPCASSKPAAASRSAFDNRSCASRINAWASRGSGLASTRWRIASSFASSDSEQAPSPLHLLVPPIPDEELERRRDRRETRRDERHAAQPVGRQQIVAVIVDVGRRVQGQACDGRPFSSLRSYCRSRAKRGS